MSDILADKEFAQKLCNEEKNALAEFQRLNADELYFIASKFNNGGVTGGSWTYHRKAGKPIKVSGAITDTYLWLLDEAIKKSCKYKGKNNASFQTYIKTTLNSKFTFIDWKRSMPNSSLIQHPRNTGYIPRVIKNLGDIHGKVFIMLTQYKSIGQICSKLDLEELDCRAIQNEIEIELIRNGKSYLLYPPKIRTSDPNPTEDEEGKITGIQLEEKGNIPVELSLALKNVIDPIELAINNLGQGQKRILHLYWTEGIKIDQIYEIMIDNSHYYEDLSINKKEDINKIINKCVYNLFSDFESDYPELISDYDLDRKNWRNLIKTIFENYNYKN